MRLSREELKGLMKNKLIQAGLREDHADQTAEILTWAHERGFASHGAVRVEYYCERIFKGGITHEPNITWNQTGPCSGTVSYTHLDVYKRQRRNFVLLSILAVK